MLSSKRAECWFTTTLSLSYDIQFHIHASSLQVRILCFLQSRLEQRANHAIQNDPREKGRQVQLMAKIYENGSRTLVWLGPDREGIAQETVAFIKETSQTARDLIEKYGSVQSIPALPKEDNPISQDVEKWKLFDKFVNFVWFTRVWVMQEVGVASVVTMNWGDAVINFSDVISVNEFQRHAPHLLPVWLLSWYLHDAFLGVYMWYGDEHNWKSRVIPDLRRLAAKFGAGPTFMDVMIQSSRRNASDPRDHVYALLGHPLATIGDETIVKADYERHVDDVFLEVTVKLMQNIDPTLPLSIACNMGARGERNLDGDQPSWVVRWELGQITSAPGRPIHWHHAGGKGTTNIAIDATLKTLTVPAVIFDRVAWFSDLMLKSTIDIDKLVANPEARPAIDMTWETLPAEPCIYPTAEARRDAFTLCFVSAVYRSGEQAEDDMARHRRNSAAYLEYLKSARGGKKAATGTLSEEEQQLFANARTFETAFTWSSHDRRIMVTEKGFYGLAPPLLRVGDVVGIFPGAKVPYVMRPVTTGNGNTYKLVGACFVHGVMRGEVLDPSDPLGLNLGEPKEIVIV